MTIAPITRATDSEGYRETINALVDDANGHALGEAASLTTTAVTSPLSLNIGAVGTLADDYLDETGPGGGFYHGVAPNLDGLWRISATVQHGATGSDPVKCTPVFNGIVYEPITLTSNGNRRVIEVIERITAGGSFHIDAELVSGTSGSVKIVGIYAERLGA